MKAGVRPLHRSAPWALTVLACTWCVSVWAQPAPTASGPVAAVPNAPVRTLDVEQLTRKLKSTQTLLESSSGAKQIQASQVPAALSGRQQAVELHAQAQQALQAGDRERASRLLDEAAQVFFKAVRQAEPQQITGAKVQADFDNRLNATRALLDAQKRIAQEKSAGPRAAELTRKIEALMQQAQGLAQGGQVAEGRKVLDEAYLAAKAAIGGMRNGETVVRSLNFASKAEEYHYEVDRNDTHAMLVKVLLKDRRGNAQVDAMVTQATQSATALRQQADALAAKKDYEAAIKTLEDSTRELVKAIRGAGVYIPG